MRHLFIINPIAGSKKGRFAETEREIRAFAESLNDPYEIYVTKAPMDACHKIAAEAEASSDQLIVYACGGDGTLNECANGAAGRANTAITHYPCGTGNDFIKMFGSADEHRFRDLQTLASGAIRPIDLIDCNGRYGINICSVGADARIGTDVHKYSSLPIVGGPTGYVVSIIVNMVKGLTQKMRITTGEDTLEGVFTLVCACNGRFYGGGFNPVPDAIPDDGILEFLIIKGISRLRFIQVVGKYAKGRFRELSDVITHIRGSRLAIESEDEIVVNLDGEAIYAEKISFRVVPGGVNFLFPSGMEYFNTGTK